MSNDHTELSADQLKLVEAFQAAAQYFADRILNKAEIDPDMETATVEKIVSSHGPSQANSKIADEAGRRFSAVIGINPEAIEQDITQALKFGGANNEGGFFVGDATEVNGERKRSKLSSDCYNSIIRNLFGSETARSELPPEYIVDQINAHGGNLPKPTR